MGLRINSNLSALTALRTLRVNERNQARSLERLSTGLQINRASDDPSGMLLSDLLRSQISALDQAVDNSQNAQNLVAVADAGLQNVSDMLIGINDAITFALNSGGNSPDQIAAEQEGVDHAIAAIDRIANTTRYSDRELLNGSAAYQLVSNRPGEIQNLRFQSINFANGEFTRSFQVEIDEVPERAQFTLSGVRSSGVTTLRITGPRGTQDVVLTSASTASGLARAVNSVAGFTGVWASGTANDVVIASENFGRDQEVRMEVVEGYLSATQALIQDDAGPLAVAGPFNQGAVLFDRGQEGSILFDGARFVGKGLDFSILNRVPILDLTLNADLFGTTIVSGATFTFDVADTALNFQLNELPQPTDTLAVGIESIATSVLGFERVRDTIDEAIQDGLGPSLVSSPIYKGGFLTSLKTGGGNDLFQNPTNGSHIAKEALNQVGRLRAWLGAVVADAIEPNTDSLLVTIENVTAALSDIRDLDFAEETAAFVRNQILFQSNVGVLASANTVPQSVLTLLGV
jgi:flagellin